MEAVVKKLRVHTWATDGASVLWFNTLLPYSALDPERFECTYGLAPPEPGWQERYDVIVGQRLTDRCPLWQEICAHPDVLAVYSIDDDLTNIDPENTVPYSIYMHPNVVEGTKENIRHADVVTVPTWQFAERMGQHNSETFILPLTVPDEMFEWPIVPNADFTVGWSGSMFKAQDWNGTGLPEALVRYAQIHPGTRYHTVGANYLPPQLYPLTRFTGWTDIMSSYRVYDWHIGMAPLMDSYFNALKSRTKLIEYGARGIPTVASAVGEYVDWIDHGENGMLAKTPGEWTSALTYLTDNPSELQRMGAAARKKAEEAKISNNIHLWEQVYEGRWKSES
jgi:glycosyl transferase family 1